MILWPLGNRLISSPPFGTIPSNFGRTVNPSSFYQQLNPVDPAAEIRQRSLALTPTGALTEEASQAVLVDDLLGLGRRPKTLWGTLGYSFHLGTCWLAWGILCSNIEVGVPAFPIAIHSHMAKEDG